LAGWRSSVLIWSACAQDILGPQIAQTLPPAKRPANVGLVNMVENGAGAAGGGMGRDPPDRTRLRQLAEEQAALRRVATLVARGARPEEVFAVVAEEVGQLLPVDSAALCRYEPDGALTFVSQWGNCRGPFSGGQPVDARRP